MWQIKSNDESRTRNYSSWFPIWCTLSCLRKNHWCTTFLIQCWQNWTFCIYFVFSFLFFAALQFSIIKSSHNKHALFFFLFKSQTPLFQNWNKSSLRQTRPLICPRYQKIYPFIRLVMLIFLLRTGTPSNSYIVFG